MFGQLLIHTAQVYRRSAEETAPTVRRTDRLGQELSINPRQHEVDGQTLVATYPCRVDRGRGGLLMNERMVDTFETTWTMFTEAGVDIRADDAVRVLGPDGDEIVPLAKVRIKSFPANARITHHLEFELWAQSGPN